MVYMTKTSNTRLEKMVNILSKTCEAKSVVVFMENKDEFNEDKTPCMISAFPHVPSILICMDDRFLIIQTYILCCLLV